MTVKIYDVLGKEIKVLVNEFLQVGDYKTEFDGEKLSSGIYFYQLEAGGVVDTKKMMLMK